MSASRFPIDLKSGLPLYEQVVYAARKAILSGLLQPGDPFPSLRQLSAELRINPNTVQKALNTLKAEGLIEIVPGIGGRVCPPPSASAAGRSALLDEQLEAVALRARQLGISPQEVKSAFDAHWHRLGTSEEPTPAASHR
jgi:GntR family transcriptional regulator